jgi:mono/diheme cytochrome c family protein
MKHQFLQSRGGVSLLAVATLLAACSRLLPAAPADSVSYIALSAGASTGETASQQQKPAGVALSEFAPMSYFESNCARCHGSYGSFYGEGFGQELNDSKLRQVVHDMAAGPGNAPVTEPQLDALTAYHRSLIDGKPFLIINAVRDEKDAARTLQGETTPESQLSVRWEGGTAAATVEGYTWTARLPANVDWSKVEIVAKKGDTQTVLKAGESEYSHRAPLDKIDDATQK